ncbi:NAD/FAD-utilizing enzyme [Halioglobus maricola]|uniref:NAD/FAD-utilizing enzyme n=1 Tax=Halioglobus maricola TaxID=2601894 RepID=A0A5P9NQD7_9GAMM|nr:NAD/FAD-utilizing enzyme [Halioglobus maricola]QFU77665.1 NAD/FAD-utilizing enzyme [Halioglobus maricola]
MKRHYFVSDNLDQLQLVSTDLQQAGFTTPQIHVLSRNDAGISERRLNDVEAVLKKDVVRGTERGALVGVALASTVLVLAWVTGFSAHYTWVPSIFLAIVLLGFCTWEGGLIGIGKPHADFARFEPALRRGKHVMLVDTDPDQEQILDNIVAHAPGLRPAGTGEATPRAVVRFQDKWARFTEIAP